MEKIDMDYKTTELKNLGLTFWDAQTVTWKREI